MLSLDLCRSQGHRLTVVNAMEGNLLDARLDVMQAVDEQKTPGIDGRCSLVRCQLKIFQLHR